MILNRKRLFFPVFAVGIAVLFFAIKLRPDLPIKPISNRARLVEIQPLEQTVIAPLLIGFGNVAPKVEWKAIAEISGKVVYRHPQLEKGQILAQGTEILRIDPFDYQLKLRQAEAELQSSQTSLMKLNQQAFNLQQTLMIEQKRLALSRAELARTENLVKKGGASQSDLDQRKLTTLALQSAVQDIENQLSLIPDEKRVAQAVVDVNQWKVKEAERQLEKTRIILPQTLRIAQVDIEESQVVNTQQMMVVAHGLDVMEVDAQFSLHDMQTLFSSFAGIDQNQWLLQQEMPLVTSMVELSSGHFTARWPAQVMRISETVAPAQATVGVILEITQEPDTFTSGRHPMLLNGMFVKITLEGQSHRAWVIPEHALHGDKIYLMDDDQRLKILPITVRYRRADQVVISGDLNSGQRLILNDLLPAVEGMLLRENQVEGIDG